ncbi:bifunctional glycosyltransferase/CDP-glycerol:glycerophosphate glycerophosphotransferase [Glutamicibacter creatinolyticus]|uniref:bifunctional glycosyltransferase/CDP-glycerol:glycerophosphate glycerophosphotransferase n=1 Tax=Glutamicibacter creatinolyticus TaxID=162496 RepID=UPI0031DDD313
MNVPTFSAVIAAYNIEKYAEDLFRSIEKQSIRQSELEVIIIDDGSDDETLAIARRWASTSRFDVTVDTQVNLGVAAARNRGIDYAQGTWIAFVDSDDVLDRNYFKALETFILRDTNNSASMLTSRSLIFNEQKGIAQDNHPLGWKYRRGDRLVSLTDEPHVIHLGGHSTIVRRQVIMKENIRFSPLVKPAFEDAHFIGMYLGQFDEPVLGLVASARYYYRKRADGSSLIDTTWTKPEKYTNEPKYGHLGLLRYLNRLKGHTPEWAQNMVLYSLYWYFRADRALNSPLKDVQQELLDQLWESLYEIFSYIDAAVIRKFNLVNYGWALKEGILRHFKGESYNSRYSHTGYMWNADDIRQDTRKIGYTYTGSRPKERISTNGQILNKAIIKSIQHTAFGRTLMYERVIIIPRVKRVELYLNDQRVDIVKPESTRCRDLALQGSPERLQLASGSYKPSASELVTRARQEQGSIKFVYSTQAFFEKLNEEAWITNRNHFIVAARLSARVLQRYRNIIRTTKQKNKDVRSVEIANELVTRELYKDAWIIADHPVRADDNGEHFYRYLRDYQPDINAFFLIKRDSDDWERLANDGFRLIAYGSQEAINAALNAKYIVASHIDAGIYDPVSRHRFGPSPARRIFLQHGMVMNDLSRWLNTKGLALMISSSPYEYEHFVGEGSKYKFTPKEVSLSGLARHDALVRGRWNTPDKRSYISFAPTWRQGLANSLKSASNRSQQEEILKHSEFYNKWKEVLLSSRLSEICQATNSTIIFVLHDHLAKFEHLFDFGPNVQVSSFKQLSVQEFLLSSRVLITDYSSIATEAAITGAPVAYYQFDSDSIYGTGHTFTKGWFEYDQHGFGPVINEVGALFEWLEALVSSNWKVSEIYRHRLQEILPTLDGQSCVRIFDSIQKLDNKLFADIDQKE